MAGIGAGLVINFTPRLLDRRWENPTTWASILLPVTGPAVIAAATMRLRDWSDWQWGFLVEGAAALVSLLLLVSMTEEPELASPSVGGWPAFLPFLVLGSAAMVYCLHWGQLHGWLESSDIVVDVGFGHPVPGSGPAPGLSPARLPRPERGLDAPAAILLWRLVPVLPRNLDEYLRRAGAQFQLTGSGPG